MIGGPAPVLPRIPRRGAIVIVVEAALPNHLPSPVELVTAQVTCRGNLRLLPRLRLATGGDKALVQSTAAIEVTERHSLTGEAHFRFPAKE